MRAPRDGDPPMGGSPPVRAPRRSTLWKRKEWKRWNWNFCIVCKCLNNMFPFSSVCFPIALATSLFLKPEKYSISHIIWKIELIFETALKNKTSSPLAVGCSVTNAMALSSLYFLSRFVGDMFPAHVQKSILLPKWFKRFQYRKRSRMGQVQKKWHMRRWLRRGTTWTCGSPSSI